MLNYIVFDTETTGLIKSRDFPLFLCPKIIEFSATRVDKEFNVLEQFNMFIDPDENLTEEIVNITNITTEMVRGAGNIKVHWPKIRDIVRSCDGLIGHNVSFDMDMLWIEARRVGDSLFTMPPGWCSVEWCEANIGKRLNLTKFVKQYGNIEHKGAHRANEDVRVLVDTLRDIVHSGVDLELPNGENLGALYAKVIEKFKLKKMEA